MVGSLQSRSLAVAMCTSAANFANLHSAVIVSWVPLARCHDEI